MTRGPAGELLTTAIADLADGIAVRRAAALADEPDAVHQLRTTVRRLRNLLAAFRRCFDPLRADELGAVLASYGELLGRCRDLEVRAADAAAALASLDLGELDQALAGPLRARHRAAHATLVEWHATRACDELDAHLARWAAHPPLSGRAARRADAVAAKAVGRQARRVLRRADAAAAGDEEARHALRKAARRLRHTAEAVAPVDGAPVDKDRARALGMLGHEVQSALGDHRDALLLAAHARLAAGTAGAADATSYELVAEHAEERAKAALERLDAPLADLRGRVDT